MVPTAYIYSIRFGLCSPQLHQHIHPHSKCHLNNKTNPLTPDLHWHEYLHLCNLSTNKCLHHFVHATLYSTTFAVYPLLTTSTLYWIITNTSTTYINCNVPGIFVHFQVMHLVPSVLRHCWLGVRKSIRPVKNWVMRYWHGYLSGVWCKWFASHPLTVSWFMI